MNVASVHFHSKKDYILFSPVRQPNVHELDMPRVILVLKYTLNSVTPFQIITEYTLWLGFVSCALASVKLSTLFSLYTVYKRSYPTRAASMSSDRR